ncbi:uncharacterized protein LOC126619503 [Malus sylvestris]|uniref:uncharacterized protein LOC126619503 n=1 Tax=Malus sylvestris TaxID=3752 RepID=UPI0021ABFC64|nr:uncharacterized protein LOC126619503 [Malus sylvestris]
MRGDPWSRACHSRLWIAGTFLGAVCLTHPASSWYGSDIRAPYTSFEALHSKLVSRFPTTLTIFQEGLANANEHPRGLLRHQRSPFGFYWGSWLTEDPSLKN